MKEKVNMDKWITENGKGTDMIKSQYGKITFREWCKLDAARIMAHGKAVVVVDDGTFCRIERA